MGKMKMKIEKTGNHIRIRKWYFSDYSEVAQKVTDEEFKPDEFEFIDYDK